MKKIKKTQMDAWVMVLGTLPKRQKQVIQAIMNLGGRATLRDIASKLECELNVISGRITELSRLRVIVDKGRTKDNEVSGRKMVLWELNDDAPKLIKKQIMES